MGIHSIDLETRHSYEDLYPRPDPVYISTYHVSLSEDSSNSGGAQFLADLAPDADGASSSSLSMRMRETLSLLRNTGLLGIDGFLGVFLLLRLLLEIFRCCIWLQSHAAEGMTPDRDPVPTEGFLIALTAVVSLIGLEADYHGEPGTSRLVTCVIDEPFLPIGFISGMLLI
jgi:hypothetical protein